MKMMALFSVTLTMLMLLFCVVMLAVAGFCAIMKRVERKRGLSPRMAKWVDILDWLKEDDT